MAVRGVIGAAVLVAGLALGACGGDDGDGGEQEAARSTSTTAGPAVGEPSTETFVSGVCGAITTFGTQAEVVAAAGRASTPDAAVDALATAYDDMAGVVDGLAAQVETVPPPAVLRGEEIKATVTGAFRRAAEALRAIVADLQAVPDGDEEAAASAVAAADAAFVAARGPVEGWFAIVSQEFPEARADIEVALPAEHSCENVVTE